MFLKENQPIDWLSWAVFSLSPFIHSLVHSTFPLCVQFSTYLVLAPILVSRKYAESDIIFVFNVIHVAKGIHLWVVWESEGVSLLSALGVSLGQESWLHQESVSGQGTWWKSPEHESIYLSFFALEQPWIWLSFSWPTMLISVVIYPFPGNRALYPWTRGGRDLVEVQSLLSLHHSPLIGARVGEK